MVVRSYSGRARHTSSHRAQRSEITTNSKHDGARCWSQSQMLNVSGVYLSVDLVGMQGIEPLAHKLWANSMSEQSSLLQ